MLFIFKSYYNWNCCFNLTLIVFLCAVDSRSERTIVIKQCIRPKFAFRKLLVLTIHVTWNDFPGEIGGIQKTHGFSVKLSRQK